MELLKSTYHLDGDGAMVSTVVKLNTGLRNVDPEAHLGQARQIIESDPGSRCRSNPRIPHPVKRPRDG